MKKKAKSYSVDFKQEAVRRMAQATTIIGLAKELGVRRKGRFLEIPSAFRTPAASDCSIMPGK